MVLDPMNDEDRALVFPVPLKEVLMNEDPFMIFEVLRTSNTAALFG
jgi:hypothetical protein